jgi:hypothetical protein
MNKENDLALSRLHILIAWPTCRSCMQVTVFSVRYAALIGRKPTTFYPAKTADLSLQNDRNPNFRSAEVKPGRKWTLSGNGCVNRELTRKMPVAIHHFA